MAGRATLFVASAIAVAAGAIIAARRLPSAWIPSTALRASFATAAPDWLARLEQDETQRVCSRYRNAPPKAVAAAILARERARITYPVDRKLMGDWKKGEALAKSGYGGRYTDVPASAPNGGNCYACHQLDARELSYGTLGPSLTGYGKIRAFAPATVQDVYERIYNPQAAVACANMPRLGASGFLMIDQIRDLVAYVMSPESPVNR
jgi:L-cysteine S-thiosulfotransferase